MTGHFEPGTHIVVRYLVRGRVWSAVPWTVVEDTPERLKMALAPGARRQGELALDGFRTGGTGVAVEPR